MRARSLRITLILALGLGAVLPAHAQLLPVRDQNPLVRGAYLPLPAARPRSEYE